MATETVFDKIWREASSGNVDLYAKSRASINWLSREVKKYQRISDVDIHGDKTLHTRPEWGSMYLFHYFPKHQATLPYYDIMPLVFRIGNRRTGFLGMNFHYLSPAKRLKLMRGLMQDAGVTDKQTKMAIDYNFLKAASSTNLYAPTIKHYLSQQYRSQFMKIDRKDWEIALYLPTARFQKVEKETVWRKTSQQVRGMNHNVI